MAGERGTQLRDAAPADFPAILALNDAEVAHTSAMDMARLRQLHGYAGWHRVAVVDGAVAAFLLAMRDGCGYVNPNFDWFAARYPRFLYVDRVVVGAGFQGLGLGSQLYRELFEQARRQQVPVIACEYNLQPPNAASQAFHDRFGFREVGSQWLDGGAKRVSLQVAELTSSAPDA
ncbi:GNAT family N-acetyltransferase [Arenimonas sp. MALMAid1274]|uniref:GNAT family N-acetyltransferase n=1 Tax=Arenimonas sp. MALMAid1274 TaxID=3411630 RepID=UPI003B9FF8D8